MNDINNRYLSCIFYKSSLLFGFYRQHIFSRHDLEEGHHIFVSAASCQAHTMNYTLTKVTNGPNDHLLELKITESKLHEVGLLLSTVNRNRMVWIVGGAT